MKLNNLLAEITELNEQFENDQEGAYVAMTELLIAEVIQYQRLLRAKDAQRGSVDRPKLQLSDYAVSCEHGFYYPTYKGDRCMPAQPTNCSGWILCLQHAINITNGE